MPPLCAAGLLLLAGPWRASPLPSATNQDPAAPPSRPRIGLVLSGGGARGVAHVGVLQELERQRVPVDFVIGTSMGAIVGGLYAAGLSPDEIEKTVTELDWGSLLDDDPPRDQRAWRRKQEDLDFLIPLEMGWNDGGLSLPRGFVQGQKIEPFFRGLTMRAFDATDFDRLRLPFRAIAMDLATGERVVLGRGDLGTAMRASMSIAGAFAPVEIDGRELVDGMYVENLPIEVALQMSADVVIAVDVGTPPEVDVGKLGSLLSVSTHVQDVLVEGGRARARKLLRPSDVLVLPQLGTITFADFGRAVEAVAAGTSAGQASAPALAQLAVDEAAWRDYLARQRAEPRSAPAIRALRIENNSRLDDAILEAHVEARVGDALDSDVVAFDLARLYGFGVFERVATRVEPQADGAAVTYEVDEKGWGPNYLRFGLALYDDFHGSGIFSLGVGVTVTPLNARGAEWRTAVGIGTPLRIGTELWYPLDDGLRWFVSPLASYERHNYDFDEDPEIGAEVSTETWQVGADVGRVFGTWGELRIGVRSGQDRESIEGGPDTDALDVVGGIARFAWDTLDTPDFPRSGAVGELEGFAAGEVLGGNAEFEIVRLKGSAFSSSGANTIGLGVDVGTSFDDALPIAQQFRLGGFTRLSGTDVNSQTGDSLFLARLMAWRALSPERPLLGVPLYAGATAEAGAVWSQGDAHTWSDLDPAGSIFLGADTPLGPAVLGFGMSDDGRSSLFLAFGRIY